MNRRLALLATLSLLLAACGATTVDTATIEKDVVSTLAEENVEVESVDCPTDPEAKPGATYVCPYTLADGSDGEATITVRDDDGTGRWDITRPASGLIEQDIRSGYEEEGEEVESVDCDDPIKVGTTDCSVKLGDGSTDGVTVKTTKAGEFSWESN